MREERRRALHEISVVERRSRLCGDVVRPTVTVRSGAASGPEPVRRSASDGGFRAVYWGWSASSFGQSMSGVRCHAGVWRNCLMRSMSSASIPLMRAVWEVLIPGTSVITLFQSIVMAYIIGSVLTAHRRPSSFDIDSQQKQSITQRSNVSVSVYGRGRRPNVGVDARGQRGPTVRTESRRPPRR